MGTMGVPPSVLYSIPVSVCTSNSGFFLMKNSGFPHPAWRSPAGTLVSFASTVLPTWHC